jgi:hypothetical protein
MIEEETLREVYTNTPTEAMSVGKKRNRWLGEVQNDVKMMEK